MLQGNETNRELAQFPDIKRLILLEDIVGHLAMWAVRQSPYDYPDNLVETLIALKERAGRDCDEGVGRFPMLRATLLEFENLFTRWMADTPGIQAWNRSKSGHTREVFVFRDDQPDPDNDFIDLDALRRNVVYDVCRAHDREMFHDSQGGAA